MRVEPATLDVIEAVPRLRRYALSLCRSPDWADDLVQDTLLKALSHCDRFERGTNLDAWLFTILRNTYFVAYRKRRCEVEDVEGGYASRLTSLPDQEEHLAFEDFRRALMKLTPRSREALLLIGVEGISYEDAASSCGCKVGTIKSRVSRARTRLAERLHLVDGFDLGPDWVTRAALQHASSERKVKLAPSAGPSRGGRNGCEYRQRALEARVRVHEP
jgi:RNA polymerase sigma-70 factor, ECF subfamily